MTNPELVKMIKYAKYSGIMTSVHYKPLHEYTAFKKIGKTYEKLTNSKKLYKNILSLPLYPHISKNEINYVIKSLIKYSR